MGVFGYAAYGATKFAIRGFSDVLRAEMKPHGIRVSVVFPPDTDTPQLPYETPLKPPETKVLSRNAGLMSADVVAREILLGIQKNKYVILARKPSFCITWADCWETRFTHSWI